MIKDLDGDQTILQTVSSEKNTYLVLKSGEVYAMGANDKWQCTEIESMKGDDKECIKDENLRLNQEDEKWL